MLYFDHNATTPFAPEVRSALVEALDYAWGNASSVHRTGQIARQGLEQARRSIAAHLHAKPDEVVFTSGGTEANNLALLGVVPQLPGPKHVVVSSIEHPAVLETARQLECDVSFVRPSEVMDAIRPETVLVSLMHANNETGSIQPVAEVTRRLHALGRSIFVHSDGVQAFGKIPVDVHELGVDLYSVAAHKINGPKGIGALYVKKGTPLHPILFGGKHERQRRPGTENVAGAVAFARAVDVSREVKHLRDRFERELVKAVPGIRFNGAEAERLPNTSNVLFESVSGEAMVIALDMHGIAVSSGSACSSGSIEPSHVLLAMGLTRGEAKSSVRFSFGWGNTEQDVDTLLSAVQQAVARLRKDVVVHV